MDGRWAHRKASAYTEQHKTPNKRGDKSTLRVELETHEPSVQTIETVRTLECTATSCVFCFVEMHNKNSLLLLSL